MRTFIFGSSFSIFGTDCTVATVIMLGLTNPPQRPPTFGSFHFVNSS